VTHHFAAGDNSFFGADRLDDLRGFDRVQAREKQPDIASGCTEAQLGGLEKLDGNASLCEPIRRRDTYDATADDNHIRCGAYIIVGNSAIIRLRKPEGAAAH
jgi:hypothetical protein